MSNISNQIDQYFNFSNADVILLRLMQLFSANSPLGNFHYSHGLEFAVNQGWIKSVSEFIIWQQELINGQLLYLDLPIINRFYCCYKNNEKDRCIYYLKTLLSFRDTYELRMEERDRGEIVANLILQLGLFVDDDFWTSVLTQSILAGIAWIGYMWNIPVKVLCLGYAYSSLESNIITGLKLVPFGQFIAQKLLVNLSFKLPRILERAGLVTDRELGNGFPFQSVVSSCHEIQNSRLYRS